MVQTGPDPVWNSWAVPFQGGAAGLLSWSPSADAATGATPLALFRVGESLPLAKLFVGSTAGSLGETSAVAVILGGTWLLYRRIAPWRIAFSCILGGAAGSVVAGLAGQPGISSPVATFLAGSFLFGAAFVATEPISGAKTKPGQWIYGFAIGLLTVLLRTFSNFSEGIMFSVLLLNGFVPLLDRAVGAVKSAAPPKAGAVAHP